MENEEGLNFLREIYKELGLEDRDYFLIALHYFAKELTELQFHQLAYELYQRGIKFNFPPKFEDRVFRNGTAFYCSEGVGKILRDIKRGWISPADPIYWLVKKYKQDFYFFYKA